MNAMKKNIVFLVFILFSLFITGCKYDFIMPEEVPPIDNGGEPISFATQIAPIFSASNKCTSCHQPGGLGNPDLLTASSVYSNIVPAYVNTGAPETSKIYTNSTSGNHNNTKLTALQAQLLLTWITEGAQNN